MTTCLLCEQPDETGSYLCPGCTKKTIVRLECLPALYRGLAPFLAPASGVGQGRSGKGGPPPLPVNERVLDLRAAGGMVGVVESWLAAVRQERGWHPLAPSGGIEGRLNGAVVGLLRNMPWITVSWPMAGEFAAEIRDLARDVASVVSPSSAAERGRRIGHCPAVHENGTICGAVLQLRQGERVVTCDWCGCSFPPATWAGLKVFMDEDAAASNAA
ncbi:hypothetical protein ACFYPN_33105 [Streptomyces sp. NPDC005576]|uniref:hypothetical protein n=1 Tax=Streptomyces sp. NPDC005576 TaxID=3364726 RepID=UPI0036CB8D0C